MHKEGNMDQFWLRGIGNTSSVPFFSAQQEQISFTANMQLKMKSKKMHFRSNHQATAQCQTSQKGHSAFSPVGVSQILPPMCIRIID